MSSVRYGASSMPRPLQPSACHQPPSCAVGPTIGRWSGVMSYIPPHWRMTVTSRRAGALRVISAAVRCRNAHDERCSTPAGSSGSTAPITTSPRRVWLNQPSLGR